MGRRLLSLVVMLFGVVVACAPAAAATRVRTYSPIDADGTLRDGLHVHVGGGGDCQTGSYIEAGAYRCFEGT